MAPVQPSNGPNAQDTFSVSDLNRSGGTSFCFVPSEDVMRSLAEELNLLDLQGVQLSGRIDPAGQDGWDLKARLSAKVVQPCIVSLQPVATEIEEDVIRHYRHVLPDDDMTGEVELPEDDALEQLGPRIDPSRVLTEALALALPLYPRAEEAELENAVFTEPGKTAMTDDAAKPLAGLAELRHRMEKDPD